MITSVPRLSSLPSEYPADSSLHSEFSALRRSLLVVKVSVGGEGQFFYSHLKWRGILKPSSAPFWASSRICAWTTHIKVGSILGTSRVRWNAKFEASPYGEASEMRTMEFHGKNVSPPG